MTSLTPIVHHNPFTRRGRPKWNDKHFKWLINRRQLAAYGGLRLTGVKPKLEEMAANWQDSPPLPERRSNAMAGENRTDCRVTRT